MTTALSTKLDHIYPEWFDHAKRSFEPFYQSCQEKFTNEVQFAKVISDSTNPGRRIRPSLYYALWFCLTGDLPKYKDRLPAVAIELFHTASIIIDDIIDRELLRRNKTPLFRLYNVGTASLASHFLVAKGYEILLNHPDGNLLATSWTKSYCASAIGEFMDFNLLNHITLHEQYKQSMSKTVSFFRFIGEAITIGLKYKQTELIEVLEVMGWCFQVSNDVTDLVLFKELNRHDPASSYFLPPSYMTCILVEQKVIDQSEICAQITCDRYMEISTLANKIVPNPEEFLKALFASYKKEVNNTELPASVKAIASEFIDETTKTSFWLHTHES